MRIGIQGPPSRVSGEVRGMGTPPASVGPSSERLCTEDLTVASPVVRISRHHRPLAGEDQSASDDPLNPRNGPRANGSFVAVNRLSAFARQ